MTNPTSVKTSPDFPIPESMKAWVLGNPGEMILTEKPVPMPGRAEVLVRIDAIAICATDLEILEHGVPAMVQGGLPFNKNFTFGHEYMGTVAALGPGVDEFAIGDRITVEISSERDGLSNWQPQVRVMDRTGYGLRWGQYWGGV